MTPKGRGNKRVLQTLTPQLDHIVFAIKELRNLEKIIDELRNSLEAHERVLERKNSKKIVEQAFQARTSKSKNKSHGGLS